MRIHCPFCGSRDSAEFVCRGEARDWPKDLADADAAFAYVYGRQNPAGPVRELWYHAQGCGSWIEIERDTRTHAILSAVLASQRRAPAVLPVGSTRAGKE
jgi:methylglutamate dehydrogenase subunit B